MKRLAATLAFFLISTSIAIAASSDPVAWTITSASGSGTGASTVWQSSGGVITAQTATDALTLQNGLNVTGGSTVLSNLMSAARGAFTGALTTAQDLGTSLGLHVSTSATLRPFYVNAQGDVYCEDVITTGRSRNQLVDHFVSAQGTEESGEIGELGWTVTKTGGSNVAIAANYLSLGFLGATGILVSTNGHDNAVHLGPVTNWQFAGNESFEMICAVSAVPSTGVQDVYYACGALDSLDDTDPTDGIWFWADARSTDWQATCSNAGTSTTISGGTLTTGTVQALRFEVNAAGSAVEFFVNDTSIGTISSNVPGDGDLCTWIAKDVKTGTGGSNIYLILDRFTLRWDQP